jgi:hypothetical protein
MLKFMFVLRFLELITEKRKYILISRHENAGKYRSTTVVNRQNCGKVNIFGNGTNKTQFYSCINYEQMNLG